MIGPTHYDVLGVQPDASTQEIVRAYRKVLRTVHPDVAPASMAGLAVLVNRAHEVLTDPQAREAYDAELAPAPAAAPEPEVVVEEEFDEWAPQEVVEDLLPTEPAPSPVVSASEHEFKPERITPPSLPWWALTIAPVISLGSTALAGPTLVPLLLLAPVAVAFGLWRNPPGAATKVFWVAAAVLVALQAVGFTSTDTSTTSMILGGVGVLAAVIGHFLARSWSNDRGYASGRMPLRMARHLEFGSPGLRPDQQRTAATLRQVASQVPGVRLLHRVKIGDVMVDHVLIAGTRLALFTDRAVHGGRVVVDQWGDVLLNGVPAGLEVTEHRASLIQAPYETPVPITAAGWVVFTGAETASCSSSRVEVATDADLSARVLAWLAQGHTGVVDRRLLLWGGLAAQTGRTA